MACTRSSGIWLLLAFASICTLGCGEKAQVVTPPPPEVMVARPLTKEVTKSLEFPGTTAAVQFVEIRARVEGWLDKIEFVPGARVKQGDLLFLIDPRPFRVQVDQAEAALKGREAELQLREANLKRAQQLLSSASISQLQFDIDSANATVAAAQVGIARADLEKAKLDLDYSQVRAPIPGRIGKNLIDIGNLVGSKERTLLTEIVDDSSIFANFELSERDLLMLMRRFPRLETQAGNDRGKPAIFLQLADETNFPHEGVLDFVESRVDTATGTLRARGKFSNEKGMLLPGFFVRIRVPIEQMEGLIVPELAVGIGQAGRFVLVVNKDNVVEQRMVKTGILEGTLRVIEEGISKDDLVVVNAIQRARPGAVVNPKKVDITLPQASEKAAPSQDK